MEKKKKKKKKPRKPKELENKPGKYDERNTLNDLTGKEWLLLTKSFWETETSAMDKGTYAHPAPFMVGDVKTDIYVYKKGYGCTRSICGEWNNIACSGNVEKKRYWD